MGTGQIRAAAIVTSIPVVIESFALESCNVVPTILSLTLFLPSSSWNTRSAYGYSEVWLMRMLNRPFRYSVVGAMIAKVPGDYENPKGVPL